MSFGGGGEKAEVAAERAHSVDPCRPLMERKREREADGREGGKWEREKANAQQQIKRRRNYKIYRLSPSP